ncbi:hypothetical protein NDU88_002384 [Pleurodeles waltl]|uniref:Uncharacterized protein n=1 Tax=Pleurodeles waltl TaxID=8319 RepID=A0AAV7U9I8_PLEWA|nr:hypothetical protein NDU88_002384 [Pleurodeles waltl]
MVLRPGRLSRGTALGELCRSVPRAYDGCRTNLWWQWEPLASLALGRWTPHLEVAGNAGRGDCAVDRLLGPCLCAGPRLRRSSNAEGPGGSEAKMRPACGCGGGCQQLCCGQSGLPPRVMGAVEAGVTVQGTRLRAAPRDPAHVLGLSGGEGRHCRVPLE